MHRYPFGALLAFLLFASSVPAQPPEPPQAKPPVGQGTAIRETTIYIPYSKLKSVFEQQGRGVFVPYEKFQKLWEQAQKNQPRKPVIRPPAGALITSIENEAVVKRDVAEVTTTLSIEQLSAGWHQIPLRLRHSAILQASIGDNQARVLFRKNQGYFLLLEKKDNGPARVNLKLKYAKAIQKTPGQNTAVFQPPQAPVNRWRIRVPETGVNVNVQPTVATTEEPPMGEAANANETVMLAFVGAAPEVRIQWTPKSKGATGLEALATARVSQQVAIEQGAVRTRAAINLAISRAELSTLSIRVPLNQKVAGVFDANVRKWGVKKTEKDQVVTVDLFQPARTEQQIVLQLERFREDKAEETISVPRIELEGVARQEGFVLVRLAGELRAETVSLQGLLQVDRADLPAESRGTRWTFAYRYASIPYALSLRVEKVLPQLTADQTINAFLQPERLTVTSVVTFDIQRAGVFQLELAIPDGFELRQVLGRQVGKVAAAIVNTHHIEGEGEKRKLVVNLTRKALGKVGLFIEMDRALNNADLLAPTGRSAKITVPLSRAVGDRLQRQSGRVALHAPESLRVNVAKQSGLRGVSGADSNSRTVARKPEFSKLREVLSYSFADEAVEFELSVERRKPHVSARQILSVEIEPGVVKYAARFHYDILYSGVKSLRIDVPESVSGRIRHDSPSIQRKVISPPPADLAKGYVAWEFTGESEFTSTADFRLQWEDNISSLEVGKSHRFTLPALRPQGADRAWGQIVVGKAENLDVQPTGEPKGLRPIDPQHDLAEKTSVANAARAFEFHEEWSIDLVATRYELEEVKRTNIEQAVIRMVVTRHGQTAVQGLYRIRSSRQRLAVKLPEEVELDSSPLRINGSPVPLEKGDRDEHYIPLAGNDISNSVLVELRYTVNSNQKKLDVPQFPGRPAMQKIFLCVFLPRELALIKHNGPWSDELGSDWHSVFFNVVGPSTNDQALIDDLMEGLKAAGADTSFARSGRLHIFSTLQPAAPPDGSLRLMTVSRNLVNVVLFGIVGLVGVGFYWQSVPRKMFAIGGLFVAAILSGVFAPTMSRHLLNVYLLIAIAAMGVVWSMRHFGQVFKQWSAMNAARAAAEAPLMATATTGSAGDVASSEPPVSGTAIESKEETDRTSNDDSQPETKE